MNILGRKGLLSLVLLFSQLSVQTFGATPQESDGDVSNSAEMDERALNVMRDPILSRIEELWDSPKDKSAIELFDYQIEQIREANTKRIKWFRSEKKNGSNAIDLQKEMEARLLKDTKEILLPHQWSAINRIAYFEVLERIGLTSFMKTGWFRDRVGIDSDQLKGLKANIDKATTEYEEAVKKASLEFKEATKKAQTEMIEQIAKGMDEKQKAKFLELLGH